MSQGGEKTEQPTDKRLKDSKKKGQVAKSQDLASAVLLIAAVGVLWLSGDFIAITLKDYLVHYIQYSTNFNEPLTPKVANDTIWGVFAVSGIVLAAILGAMFVLAFGSNFLQVGPIFAVEAVKPKFDKLNPASAFQQKFLKSRPYIELAKTLIKMVIAAVVVGLALWEVRDDVVRLTTRPPEFAIALVSMLFLKIGLQIGIAFLLIGGADFFLQKFLHRKDLKMSKKEVRDEYKEMEGDPYIKAKRRQIHREIISQGMAAAVKKSNVVVANPTHVAVALSYDKSEMDAPVIVAKGADLMAAKIRELATDAGVPIMRDIPLARALYEFEVDDEIPEELYESVAVVLRWVYEQSEDSKKESGKNI